MNIVRFARKTSRLPVWGAPVAAVLILSACGGAGGQPTSQPASPPKPTDAPVVTAALPASPAPTIAPPTNAPAPTRPPTQAPTSQATSTPAPSLNFLGTTPTEIVKAVAARMAKSGPYRVKTDTTYVLDDGQTSTSASTREVVPPDRFHRSSTSAAGSTTESILIGDTMYTRTDNGTWRKLALGGFGSFTNTLSGETDSKAIDEAAKTIQESDIKPLGASIIGGVPVVGFELRQKPSANPSTPDALFNGGITDSTSQVWIGATDGLVHKMDITLMRTVSPQMKATQEAFLKLFPTPKPGATSAMPGLNESLRFSQLYTTLKIQSVYEYDPQIRIDAPIK